MFYNCGRGLEWNVPEGHVLGVLPRSRADATFKDQGFEKKEEKPIHTLNLLAADLSIHTPSLFPGCPEVSSLLAGSIPAMKPYLSTPTATSAAVDCHHESFEPEEAFLLWGFQPLCHHDTD